MKMSHLHWDDKDGNLSPANIFARFALSKKSQSLWAGGSQGITPSLTAVKLKAGGAKFGDFYNICSSLPLKPSHWKIHSACSHKAEPHSGLSALVELHFCVVKLKTYCLDVKVANDRGLQTRQVCLYACNTHIHLVSPISYIGSCTSCIHRLSAKIFPKIRYSSICISWNDC